MKLKIHRGTKEIGGSCVEISTDSAKVLLDFGIPLLNEDGGYFDSKILKEKTKLELIEQKILPDIQNEDKDFALLISHAHPDHFGLLNYLPPQTPIYSSKITKSIIQDIAPILYKTEYNLENYYEIKNNDCIQIGDISIKTHSVDHSIADSLAFEISDDQKTIYYSGDFRTHGRQKYLLNQIVKSIDKVDYLLLEGTTIGRKEQKTLSEVELEEELSRLFKTDKLNIVIFSAQNLDRFISMYKACLRTKKTLVIDPYTAYILEKFKALSKKIPQYDWNNIKIYFAPNSITKHLASTKELYKYKEKKISIDEILATPEKYVVKDNWRISEKILKLKSIDELQIIYSLWSGYIEKEDNFWHTYKDTAIQLHTSGHADIDSLKDFAQKVNPTKIIPIHTQKPEKYYNLFGGKVLMLNDGEELEL